MVVISVQEPPGDDTALEERDITVGKCCAAHTGKCWSRVWLVGVSTQEVECFQLDHGSVVRVRRTHLRPLPSQCVGVPPQVRYTTQACAFS